MDPFQLRIFHVSMKNKIQKSLRNICNVEREKRKAVVPIPHLNECRAMYRQNYFCLSLLETIIVSEINNYRYWKGQVGHS